MATEVGSFEAIQSHGWSSGFTNLLRKELRDWWRTRFWLIQTLIWLAVLNGLVALAAFSKSATLGSPGPATGLQAFFTISPLFGPIGVAVLAQGAIVGEKQSGTAAWVLSKPVARSAFILGKLVALGVGSSAIVVGVQGVVAFALSAAATGSSPAALVPYAFALGLLALHLAFYITLALMVGTLFGSRGAVIGIGLGVLFGQQFLGSILSGAAVLLPMSLGQLAGIAATGQELPTYAPVASTVLLSTLFVTVAVWRFSHEEL